MTALSHLRTFNGHKTNIVSIEWIRIAASDIVEEAEMKIRRRDNSSCSSSQASLVPVETATNEGGIVPVSDVEQSEPNDDVEHLSATVNELTIENSDSAAKVNADDSENDQTTEAAAADDVPKFYLATGAEESLVYIWDTQNNVVAHTIRLKTHGRHSIPSEYTEC